LIFTGKPDLVIVNLIFDRLVCIPFSAGVDELIFFWLHFYFLLKQGFLGVFSSCSSVTIPPNNDVLHNNNKKLILTVSLFPSQDKTTSNNSPPLGPKSWTFSGGCLRRAKGVVASKILHFNVKSFTAPEISNVSDL